MAKGIDVTAEKAKLKIPDEVFQHVHEGNSADSRFAINASVDLGTYPRNILWSEDPLVQRKQRDAVAAAIISVKQKLSAASSAGRRHTTSVLKTDDVDPVSDQDPTAPPRTVAQLREISRWVQANVRAKTDDDQQQHQQQQHHHHHHHQQADQLSSHAVAATELSSVLPSQTCLSGVSADGRLGIAATVVGSCAGHTDTDNSFVCNGLGRFIKIMRPIGAEDFTLSMSLKLEKVDGTAASIVFFSSAGESHNHVGLDGPGWFIECTGPGGGGTCTGGPHLPTTTEKTAPLIAGKWFNLTLARTSNLLTVSVNAAKAFTLPMSFAVDGFGLRPWRATTHVRSLRVCAEHFAPAPPPPPPPLPTVTVFKSGEAGVPVYRIPALCAAGPALVAFIEGRLGGDFSIKKLMTKRSTNGGRTWSAAIVVPGTWQAGWCVGQPTCAYDPASKLLILQYQNSTAHREVNGRTYQIASSDFGATWQEPLSMDRYLGKYAGVFPGPGNGLVLSNRSKHPGRFVFAAWGVTMLGNSETNYDIVYLSDDGGKSYTLSKTVFPANLTGIFEEPTIAETPDGDVLLNMRMQDDAEACGGHHCRFSAVSTDGGQSFGPAAPVPALISSGCQGSVLLHPPTNRVLFSNPHSGNARVNGVLQFSEDAKTWNVLETIDAGSFSYSCLSLLPANAGGGAVNASHVAVLYEGHSGLILLATPTAVSRLQKLHSVDDERDVQRRGAVMKLDDRSHASKVVPQKVRKPYFRHPNNLQKTDDDILDVWMVPHAHCDVGWLMSVDGYFNERQWNGEENPNSVHAILSTVTPSLDADPSLRFIWSEIKWIEMWLPQQTPAMQAAFRRIVKSGQFEFVGAGWSQNDEVTTAYYDVIDNQVTGHEYLRRLGLECPQPGRCVRVGWQIDMFAGFSGATPSLWAMAGYDAMFLRWEGDEAQSRKFQGPGARVETRTTRARASHGYEWLWEGSDSLSANRSRIWTHSMENNYGDLAAHRNTSEAQPSCCSHNASDRSCCNPLVGFCWDDDHTGHESRTAAVTPENVEAFAHTLAGFVRQRQAVYQGPILAVWGSDYRFHNASKMYGNMSKIHKEINADPAKYGMKVRYTTLSEYVDHIHSLDLSFPVHRWPTDFEKGWPHTVQVPDSLVPMPPLGPLKENTSIQVLQFFTSCGTTSYQPYM
jgi:hypothetical protein